LPEFSKEVTITINEEQPDLAASFHVPEILLTEKSEFFQAACRNEWKEATSRVIKLPDVEPCIFNLYLFWVYRGKLAVRNDWRIIQEDYSDTAPAIQSSLVKLWILADRLADIRLRTATVDEMMLATSNIARSDGVLLFLPELTVIAWSATTPGRSLRRLIVDYYVCQVLAKNIEDHMDRYHPGFVKELALAALRTVDDPCSPLEPPFVKGICHCHEHDEKFSEQDCLRMRE
jgi:hypothetical protein